VENAIDAGSNAITVEIKEGGTSLIRITDNGIGILKEDIPIAFKRHSTSKIKSIEDLLSVSSLGFRGEALSSIAAVGQVELLTKSEEALTGSRYIIEGGVEKALEEIGCPNGTTFIIRNLFFNTPARRKFLKAPATEASYISDFVERLAISHPNVSFKFISNNQIKLHTSGNSKLKDVIYNIYGREVASQLLEIDHQEGEVKVSGYIGKPIISRGNRNYMSYFINGRYIKSAMINKALEEAYKPFTMSHRYPFVVLHFQIPSQFIDVNVHPAKMDIRFTNNDEIYKMVYHSISQALKGKELIPEVTFVQQPNTLTQPKIPVNKPVLKIPEPFEIKRKEALDEAVQESSNYQVNIPETHQEQAVQIDLFSDKLLSKEAQKEHTIIGQLFSTYWIVQYQEKMFIIDQHAAHEKVMYEKLMKSVTKKEFSSQQLLPPIILSLSMREEEIIQNYGSLLQTMGFEIEHFGGKEYSVRAVPSDIPSIGEKDLLIELIDSLVDQNSNTSPDILLEKIASMSCKAAVKGNNRLSLEEAKKLIDELLGLENPYHCPHGRPTIISMSKYEIEKKFKRIL
jgi:DNA mismatch repair protein MutL